MSSSTGVRNGIEFVEHLAITCLTSGGNKGIVMVKPVSEFRDGDRADRGRFGQLGELVGGSITQDMSSKASACSATTVEGVVVDDCGVRVPDVAEPSVAVQILIGSSAACGRQIFGLGKPRGPTLRRMRDHIGHGHPVAGHDEALAGLDPVQDVSVVVPKFPLRYERRRPTIVAPP
jgi:hypothetical protein